MSVCGKKQTQGLLYRRTRPGSGQGEARARIRFRSREHAPREWEVGKWEVSGRALRLHLLLTGLTLIVLL